MPPMLPWLGAPPPIFIGAIGVLVDVGRPPMGVPFDIFDGLELADPPVLGGGVATAVFILDPDGFELVIV